MGIHVYNTATRTERKVRSISNLLPGDQLCVGYRDWVPSRNDEFVGFTGEGEDRRATFLTPDGAEWDAYRFNGRWCVGSSADPARLYAPVLVLSAEG